jgi:hypothetical protein
MTVHSAIRREGEVDAESDGGAADAGRDGGRRSRQQSRRAVRLRQRNSLNLGMDDQVLVTMETQKETAASILQTFLLHCSKHHPHTPLR